jgi:hypothetical protein
VDWWWEVGGDVVQRWNNAGARSAGQSVGALMLNIVIFSKSVSNKTTGFMKKYKAGEVSNF